MDFTLQLIIIVTCVSVVVLLLGMLYTKFVNMDKNSLSYNYMSGTVILFATFQVVTLPTIFLRLSFTISFIANIIVLVLLCVISLILNYKRLKDTVKKECISILQKGRGLRMFLLSSCKKEEVKKYCFQGKNLNYALFLSMVMMLLIMYLYQTVYFGTAFYMDNIFYIGTAVMTLESNMMSVIDPLTGLPYETFPWRFVQAPFPIFWAFLSRVFRVHPSAMALSILPVILFAFSTSVYFNIGKMLFKKDRRKASNFLLFYLIIMIFSPLGQSTGHGLFALLLISQGKALVFVAMIPLCFYLYMRLFWYESKRADWVLLFLLMLASCMVSSMGVIFGAMCLGILGISHLILTRKIKDVVYLAICCIPNVVFAVIFVLIGDVSFALYIF